MSESQAALVGAKRACLGCVLLFLLPQYLCRVIRTCMYMFDVHVVVKVLFYAELIAVVLNVKLRYYCVVQQIKT